MAKYELRNEGCYDRELGHHIPDDEANRHWQEYLQWVMEGGVADPKPVAPPPTPQEVLNADLLQTDKEMLRGFDWLLEYLVGNGTVVLADIPQALKDLYIARKALRGA